MALSGVHIGCGYAGGRDAAKSVEVATPGPMAWSRTMASPGPTDLVAPRSDVALGDPIFWVTTAFDICFAWGPNPDASKANGDTRDTARVLLRAGDTFNVFALPGDRVAWVAA